MLNRHASARDRWLAQATSALAADPNVVGAALVGSLGRGTSDDWSDVDLWVVADGPVDAGALGAVHLRAEAPHNTRADADSFAVQFDVDGIVVHTDWYVMPRAVGDWPVDSTPIVHADTVPWSVDTFEELNGRGDRGAPPPPDPLLGNLMMTPLRVKWVARATERLVGALEHTDLLAPSGLPGWSRLTIACHLRFGAEAMRQMTIDARAGRPAAYYSHGRAEQRDGTLEPRPGESPADVMRSLRDASDSLHELWIESMDWSAMLVEPADNPDLGSLPLWHLPLFRLTEVEVHGTDLGIGLPEWSDALIGAALPVRLERLAHRVPQAPGAWRLNGALLGDGSEPEVIDVDDRTAFALTLGRTEVRESFSRAYPGP